jgi:uridine phosphorylase
MLKELRREDWLSWLNIPQERVPSILLLRATRNLKARYEQHKQLFSNILEVGSPNGIFEDVLIGDYCGTSVGYASIYGDAMASEITHVFGVMGTPVVIQTGCCGAIGDGIPAGDLVCATYAHCGEGAAQYYVDTPDVAASMDLADQVLSSTVPLHKGPIYTTSALLAEGREVVERWKVEGYIAVDMETATTFAVAEYFGMKRLSLLFAFENLSQGEHILLSDSEKRERWAKGEKAMIDIVLGMIKG